MIIFVLIPAALALFLAGFLAGRTARWARYLDATDPWAASRLAPHGAAIRRGREAAKRDATHRALREAAR